MISAAIRGSGEAAYRAIAVSGWRGHEVVQFVNVAECLNNATYLELTREFAAVVGYKFKKNWLDDRWSSTPEKAGVFHACHAEKQVAIFILRESMAHVSGTRDITLENMAALKLAQGLQKEFIIEIEHKPCNCCIRVSIVYQIATARSGKLTNSSVSQIDLQELRPQFQVGATTMVHRGKIFFIYSSPRISMLIPVYSPGQTVSVEASQRPARFSRGGWLRRI